MFKKRYVFLLVCLSILTLMGSTVFADEPVEGRAGRAEVRFLEGMIDHHQMAVDMANDCMTKAATDSVGTICQNVITAQTREIQIMRGWLLSWYGIEYTPTSMLHSDHEAARGENQGGMGMMDGGMMFGDMMGMMDSMSDMMGQMSGMMDSMMQGGMGMMGEGGMMQGGMMDGTGAMQGDRMEMMGEMPIELTNALMSLTGTLTIGQLLERTADLDPSTPLIEALDTLIASGEFTTDAEAVIPMMGGMTFGQWTMMGNEMHNLTLADIQEMQGHLADAANATLLTMMMHHMEVMVSGDSGAAASEGDHEAHHPDGGDASESSDHSQHEGGTAQGSDHSEHQGGGSTGTLTDPAMTMGMFAGLNRLTGVDYEIAWLEAMIDHHDDALNMAERIMEAAPEGVGHEQLRELAQRIITDQTAEIETMEALIVE